MKNLKDRGPRKFEERGCLFEEKGFNKFELDV